MNPDFGLDRLDRRLAEHYATEAPRRAPDRVLATALAQIDTTRQRRPVIRVPWRFPAMNTYARLAVAGVAAVVIGAVGLYAVWRGPFGPGSQPSPSPISSPSPRAGEQTATDFEYPFSYVLPPSGWEVGGGTRSMEFRVPASGGAGESAVGVILYAVTGVRENPCDRTSPIRRIHTLFDARYNLEALETLEMAADHPSSVSLQPALTMSLRAKPPTPDCRELWLWAEGDPFTSIPHGRLVETTVVDMGDGMFVIEVWGLDDHPEWRPNVQDLIESFRLPERRSPAPTPG
jgi:hypothetical protein